MDNKSLQIAAKYLLGIGVLLIIVSLIVFLFKDTACTMGVFYFYYFVALICIISASVLSFLDYSAARAAEKQKNQPYKPSKEEKEESEKKEKEKLQQLHDHEERMAIIKALGKASNDDIIARINEIQSALQNYEENKK